MSLKLHNERIRKAKETIIQGKPQSQIIIDFVAAGVSIKLARWYVKVAKKEIKKDTDNTTIEELETHLAQLDYILLDIYNEINSEPIELGDGKFKVPDVKGLIALKIATIKEKSNLVIKINELKDKVKTDDKPMSFNINVSGSQSTILSDLFEENKKTV